MSGGHSCRHTDLVSVELSRHPGRQLVVSASVSVISGPDRELVDPPQHGPHHAILNQATLVKPKFGGRHPLAEITDCCAVGEGGYEGVDVTERRSHQTLSPGDGCHQVLPKLLVRPELGQGGGDGVHVAVLEDGGEANHVVVDQVLDTGPHKAGAHIRQTGNLGNVVEPVYVRQYLGGGQVPLVRAELGVRLCEDGDVVGIHRGGIMASVGHTQLEAVLATLHHTPGGLAVKVIVNLLQHPLNNLFSIIMILGTRQQHTFLLQVDKELTQLSDNRLKLNCSGPWVTDNTKIEQ